MNSPGSLRDALSTQTLYGTFVKLPRRENVDLLALAGFDFLICDLEHGAIDEREAREVILAAAASQIPVLIRVDALHPGQINRLLEWGASGIQLPHITERSQVDALLAATRYAPEGFRSASLGHPSAHYGTVSAADYIQAQATAPPLTVGQFESLSFSGPLSETVAGLDVAFLGTFDLSVEAGTPGDTQHPLVLSVLDEVSRAAHARGVTLGGFAATPKQAAELREWGFRYIALSSDLALMASAARELLKGVRGDG